MFPHLLAGFAIGLIDGEGSIHEAVLQVTVLHLELLVLGRNRGQPGGQRRSPGEQYSLQAWLCRCLTMQEFSPLELCNMEKPPRSPLNQRLEIPDKRGSPWRWSPDRCS